LKDQKKFDRRAVIHLSLGLAAGLLSTRIISKGPVKDECQPTSKQAYLVSAQDDHKMELKSARQAINPEKLRSIPGTYELEQPINGMRSLIIRREKEQFYLEVPGYTSMKLKPAGKDRFSARAIGRVYHFYSNARGQTEKVSIQRMSTGREEGIAKKKV
jgi:hypothetical protein